MQNPLTDLAVKAAPHPPSGHTMLWDTVTRGFGVRVGKQSKTFLVLIGKGRRHTIGRYPLISLADARTEAKRILAEKTLGKTKPRFLAYEDARDRFLAEITVRPSTLAGYRYRLTKNGWGRSNLIDITPRDVLKQLKVYDDRPMEKRYAFVVLRTFFNWCVEQHLIDTAPTNTLATPTKNDSRDRVLTPAELKAIWYACPDNAFGHSVKVLMLTGLRRGEVEHLEVNNYGVAKLEGANTKNHRGYAFPIPADAQFYLTTPLKWSGWGKSKKALDNASKVANWTLHDLRRTYATIHAELRTPPHVIEALLNHKSGIVSGVAAVYNRYQYFDEMVEAVANFQRWFNDLLADKVPAP